MHQLSQISLPLPQVSTLLMPDSGSLHCVDYLPPQAPHSAIVLMHGLGEHCGRYDRVVAFFCAQGFAVRTYDHRGHGRSAGARGDLPGLQSISQDAEQVFDDWRERCPSSVSRHFLLGHSMGGLFAAQFALSGNAPIDGLILSSPALALKLNFAQLLLLKTLTALAPGLAIANGLKTRYLSHNPAVEAAYKADVLVHDRISARLLNTMLAAMSEVQLSAASLSVPTLLLVAGDDRLVDSSGSLSFTKSASEKFLQMHTYPSLYHELFNEANADPVFADMQQWLEQTTDKVAA